MTCTLTGQIQIPTAVVTVDRLHGDGEDQQELSGLAHSLRKKEPDICLFGDTLCRDQGREVYPSWESTEP